MGGDLMGTGGRCPKNLRCGTPMHPSPQYFEILKSTKSTPRSMLNTVYAYGHTNTTLRIGASIPTGPPKPIMLIDAYTVPISKKLQIPLN